MTDWPKESLLHPLYGSAARDIQAAVGISSAARLDSIASELEATRRSIVLNLRAFRGITISQDGTYLGHRATPGPGDAIALDADETIIIEPGYDTHELKLSVDTDVVCTACGTNCTDVLACISENETFLDWLCARCDGPDPGPWPG